MLEKIKPYLYPATFLISTIGMAGSLYFSEVKQFPPCPLCWYQRITLYPIVALSLVAMWRRDQKAYAYILPLSIIGTLIAAYQSTIYYAVNLGFIASGAVTCQNGVSCTANYFELFGFISIPLMSFAAHLAITVAMLLAWRSERPKSGSPVAR